MPNSLHVAGAANYPPGAAEAIKKPRAERGIISTFNPRPRVLDPAAQIYLLADDELPDRLP